MRTFNGSRSHQFATTSQFMCASAAQFVSSLFRRQTASICVGAVNAVRECRNLQQPRFKKQEKHHRQPPFKAFRVPASARIGGLFRMEAKALKTRYRVMSKEKSVRPLRPGASCRINQRPFQKKFDELLGRAGSVRPDEVALAFHHTTPAYGPARRARGDVMCPTGTRLLDLLLHRRKLGADDSGSLPTAVLQFEVFARMLPVIQFMP